MKTKLSFVILIGILFFYFTNVSAQISKRDLPYASGVGIAISQNSFDRMIKQTVFRMKKNKYFSKKDLITMVRIYNTIDMNGIIEKTPTNKEFDSLFNSKFDRLFVKRLHAKDAIGLSYYSKDCNIYLGGKPRDNSMFRIVKN